MAGSLVLTVDELRALSRLVEVSLPRFVTDGDPDEVRVDAAALRGMAARGLVTIQDAAELADVRLADELDRRLAPCATASLLAEVEVETGGTLARYAVVGWTGGPVARLTDRPAGYGAGFVALELADRPVSGVLAQLCGLDAVTGPGDGGAFTVDVDAHAEADELVLDGDREGAVAVLTAAGAPAAAARGWVAAVCARHRAVAVSVARNLGDGPDGPFESTELRWLVAGDGTGWRVDPGELSQAVVRPADAGELARGLDLLLDQ